MAEGISFLAYKVVSKKTGNIVAQGILENVYKKTDIQLHDEDDDTAYKDSCDIRSIDAEKYTTFCEYFSVYSFDILRELLRRHIVKS